MTPAIYYHPDGYETSREHLMGRHAAGEGFLKAICRHTEDETLYCFAGTREHFEHFAQKVNQFSKIRRACKWIHPSQWAHLKEAGNIFMSGPVLSDLAWMRRHGSAKDFSLCGITHTTATDRAMDAIGNLLVAPVQPWDALICTSESVKKMVKSLLENYADYLGDRFGNDAKKIAMPELPVIPLGIETDDFAIAEDKKISLRTQWREQLKIGNDEPVVLYVGRFSFHDKAHPLAMYTALETAARSMNKKIHLLMAGWFQNEQIQKEYIDGAKIFCPSVNVIFLDGRNQQVRQTIWYAADIFTSLPDNVQETFGLTPIEAMAAGLPVVVSDWDGYKETVRHNIDGLRVPTCAAPPGFGAELALWHALGVDSYGKYVGNQSQFTSVDILACAAAYVRLLSDSALRKQMSIAGEQRAKEVYDWRVVMRQYEKLWAEQKRLRESLVDHTPRRYEQPANPLRDDPFTIFADYATFQIAPETKVKLLPIQASLRLELINKGKMSTFANELALSSEETNLLLKSLADNGPTTVKQLCAVTPPAKGRSLLFSLLWLAKVGILHLEYSPGEINTTPERELSRIG